MKNNLKYFVILSYACVAYYTTNNNNKKKCISIIYIV